ncbi:MAG: hypothetical protein PHY30_01840 [Candidatus Pacebacteria bacterium]|nr:hypothetical protein [Candidatus Paceibacterota bacterium]
MKIYPTITTLVDYNQKIEEVKALRLEKVCVFFTGLNFKERKDLVVKLKTTSIKEIPFAHIRGDMTIEELNFLIENYHTQRFNIHTEKDYPLKYSYSKYRDKIYIENVHHILDENEIRKWAGICLDLSHLENERLMNPHIYKANLEIIKRNKIGCNHISAARDYTRINEKGEKRYDDHFAKDVSDFDYLKKYNRSLFSDFCAMELNNSIEFQLKAINYIMNE